MPKWHEAASCNLALSRFESDPVLHGRIVQRFRTLVSRTSHRGSNPRTPATPARVTDNHAPQSVAKGQSIVRYHITLQVEDRQSCLPFWKRCREAGQGG